MFHPDLAGGQRSRTGRASMRVRRFASYQAWSGWRKEEGSFSTFSLTKRWSQKSTPIKVQAARLPHVALRTGTPTACPALIGGGATALPRHSFFMESSACGTPTFRERFQSEKVPGQGCGRRQRSARHGPARRLCACPCGPVQCFDRCAFLAPPFWHQKGGKRN